MEIKAELKYLHISPRKVRLVASLIKGMDMPHAEFQLSRMPKRSSGVLLKLLKSAVANAVHNFDMKDRTGLYIKQIVVNEGPVLKRMMPRALGRGALIKKRMSHVKLVLDTKETHVSARAKKKKEGPVVRDITAQDLGEGGAKIKAGNDNERNLQTRRNAPSFVRRVFRRKAI